MVVRGRTLTNWSRSFCIHRDTRDVPGMSTSRLALGGLHGPGICPGARCARRTRDARVSIMHNVNQREAPEVLAHSSDGASVPELGEGLERSRAAQVEGAATPPTHRSLLPLAASAAVTTNAAEPTAAAIGAISALSGSRPTAGALVG